VVKSPLIWTLCSIGLMLVALITAGALMGAEMRYIQLDSGVVLHVTMGRFQAAVQCEPGSHGVMFYKDDGKLCEAWLDSRW